MISGAVPTQGREVERQALHSLIVQAAVLNKTANSNAMFLLKCKFGYREFDSPHSKVDVNVAVANNVLVVTDHGTDEDWQRKAAEQQRRLSAPQATTAPQLEAPKVEARQHYELVAEAQTSAAHPAPVAPAYAPSWKPRG